MKPSKQSPMDRARQQAAEMMRLRVDMERHIAEHYPGRRFDYGLMLELKRDLRIQVVRS